MCGVLHDEIAAAADLLLAVTMWVRRRPIDHEHPIRAPMAGHVIDAITLQLSMCSGGPRKLAWRSSLRMRRELVCPGQQKGRPVGRPEHSKSVENITFLTPSRWSSHTRCQGCDSRLRRTRLPLAGSMSPDGHRLASSSSWVRLCATWMCLLFPFAAVLATKKPQRPKWVLRPSANISHCRVPVKGAL